MKKSLLAALALAASATLANAGSIDLIDPATNIDSGWTAQWATVYDSIVSINVDSVKANAVFIEKQIDFVYPVNNNGFYDPVQITFTQRNANATPYVALADEILINDTGAPWGGFVMTVLAGNNAAFDPAQSAAFSVNPFATASFNASNTVLTLTDGMIGTAIGSNLFRPGVITGELWISAAGPFTLKEQPLPIPLPLAAWTGLSGLLGMGLFGAAKSLRKA